MSGVVLNSSLSESMKIKGDYVHVSFLNEFDHVDQSDFETKPRHVNPTFNTENKDFAKDLQIIVDENYANNQFLGLFNTKQSFSLTETLMKWVPDNLKQYAKIIEGFMTTSTVQMVLPEINQEFSLGKRVDVRCGFSK